jgi:hypothetical protein
VVALAPATAQVDAAEARIVRT